MRDLASRRGAKKLMSVMTASDHRFDEAALRSTTGRADMMRDQAHDPLAIGGGD